MEQIIGKIYKEVLGENEGVLAKKDKEQSMKEWGLYDELYEKLSKSERDTFCEYLNILNDRHESEKKDAYEKGFKTAVCMILESLRD